MEMSITYLKNKIYVGIIRKIKHSQVRTMPSDAKFFYFCVWLATENLMYGTLLNVPVSKLTCQWNC